ncbi:hypothetical protein E4T66_20470 [Sinimarinibacterium sp. CAU 1509]|uniref:major capsid protein n=1 Tax=Sinimarinibacterium sp. CAU 1509 TaxID=2562283 RepID=UPI0010AB7DE6|nr:major capsid protein [Sinimarinibacterium sp. CAU 1509]TJY55758.1 hypothetical protein E4T66_20470 [Sinimarinibacterium sp. CAU 1509]
MKYANVAKKYGVRLGTAVAASAATVPAFAVTDYSSLTTAVDWADVGTALLAVGVAIIGIVVVMKGIKMIVRAVKGA